MEIDLPFIFAGIIAFSVLAYIVLDGFDLGIGILFPFIRNERARDRMMNTVAPIWDGNETWLVLGGGGLFAAFPLAYAVVMPALYAPIVAMLLALVFRGVAFEFRFKTERAKPIWNLAFAGGSTLAAFTQGIALGALVQGIELQGRAYGGGWWDWLTPFSLTTGVALVLGYALLGATWLIWRLDGQLQDRMRRLALPLGIAVLALIGIVSLWTPLLHPSYAARWFSWPEIVLTAPVPLLVLALAFLFWRGIQEERDLQPFLCAQGIFLLCYAGIGISFYPYIVPPALTIHAAAAPHESLAFMIYGVAILLPIIIGYTAYSYWVFRGKVRSEGYH